MKIAYNRIRKVHMYNWNEFDDVRAFADSKTLGLFGHTRYVALVIIYMLIVKSLDL